MGKATAKSVNDGGTATKRRWRLPRFARTTKKKRTKATGRWKLWLRRILLALVFVGALPFLLTLLYRFEGIRPVSTLMLADTVRGQSYERDWRDLDTISPLLVQSVLMSEDGQFCSHHGVDLGELRVVVEAALQGEATRGASTITMQTAKNLFLWNGRSFLRKGLELPLAVWIDLVIPKDRLMEIYLNIAEWGDGIYGVGAGTQHHFNRDAGDLSRRQAALMAVTLPNPYARNPAKPSNGMTRVAQVVERRARQSGAYIGCVTPDG
ncbi:MAG: monofunctional biosynthetic peptidoglycan transglycosylase [Pseudomonadota bacterium]